jgi:hypothetical protein
LFSAKNLTQVEKTCVRLSNSLLILIVFVHRQQLSKSRKNFWKVESKQGQNAVKTPQ